jgi:hypothetical protein
MAVFMLESLVLRGMRLVKCESKAVELRRDAGMLEGYTTPEIPISTSFQPPSWQESNSPVGRRGRKVGDDFVDGAATGAGRSLGLAGVLCPRSAALDAAWGGCLSAAPSFGASSHPLAVHRRRIPPARLAVKGEATTSGRPSTLGVATKRLAVQRTLAASTRRKGGR